MRTHRDRRQGLIEAPQNADVAQLKRLIWYSSHQKLLPSLQVRGMP